MANYSVRVRDVRKVYRSGNIRVKALDGISFALEKGDFAAIVGPSGSGKSTLMNIIGTIDRPTSGEVYIDGMPTSHMTGDSLSGFRNRKLGFVFQAFNLVNGLDAQKNIELPLMLSPISEEERRNKVRMMLSQLGLSDRAGLKPTQLSGGQQQRVAIARALVNDPTLILADEPTGNLDSRSGRDVIKLLKRISDTGSVTIVIVTHNPDIAKACNKVIHLKDGRIDKQEVRRR